MGQVRILGDPFGEDAAAVLLRSFLRLLLASGVRCSLSLVVEPREPQPGQRAVASSDGVRDLRVATSLPPAEVEFLLRAAGASVASTAPVVVFAAAERRADAVRAAGLAWPRATAIVGVREGVTAQELLERVRAEVRWAGVECPPHALDERDLAPWLQLPPSAKGPIVAVGDGTSSSGLDVAIAVWRQRFARAGRALRVVVDGVANGAGVALRGLLGEDARNAEVITAPFQPAHVLDAVAVLMPFRRFTSARHLVQALASGRPVCASRFAASAPLLAGDGVCLPIGGRVVDGATEPPHFEPHPAAIAAALQRAVDDVPAAAATGLRGRSWVVAELMRDAPAAPPPAAIRAAPTRPVLVLEAPFFAPPPTAEVAIATAQALVRRDRVDVRLVTTLPMQTRLDELRARAPELVDRLCRDTRTADLWVSSGPRSRVSRPPCQEWALQVDHEHGALPLDALPHVTQDADAVLVPSEHVLRAVTAAGRSPARIHVVPHGVGPELHDGVAPDRRIVAWKQQRPAVLFCGAPIWRKGIDVFLRAVLGAHRAGASLCAVVKVAGQDRHAGVGHRDLLERFQQTTGTPPLLVVDESLSRDQLAALYTACDLMLHPYRAEGFCLPVLEARACGLPVLATGSGAAAAAMVGPGVVAIPATRRDVELHEPHASPPWVLEPSAAETERLLLGMLGTLQTHQRAARAYVPQLRTAFSWDVAAAALEDLATAAMQKRREPVVALARTNAHTGAPLPPEPVRS